MDSQEKTFWLNYINHQVDRDSSRIKNSGITGWALLTLVVIILYRLIDDFDLFLQNDRREILASWFPYFLSMTFNALLCLFFFFTSIAFSLNVNLTKRLLTEGSQRVSNIIVLFTVIILGVFLWLNYISLQHSSSSNYSKWPFFIFIIVYIAEISISVWLGIRRIYYNLIKGFRIPDFSSLIFENESPNKLHIGANLFMFLFLTCITIVTIKETTFNLTFQEGALLFRIALELIGLALIFLFLPLKLFPASKLSLFEELEQQIIKGEISDENTRRYIDEKIFGTTVREWLGQKRKEFVSKHKEHKVRLKDIMDELHKVHELDQSDESTARSRFVESFKNLSEEVQRMLRFTKQIFFQLKELTIYVTLNEAEKGAFDEFQVEARKTKEDVKDGYNKALEIVKQIRDKFGNKQASK